MIRSSTGTSERLARSSRSGLLSRLPAALALAVLLAGPPGAVRAEAGAEEGWGYSLWHELMSPYCPGRTLADCPSSEAERLRAWIVQQEEAGQDREAVLEVLLERFGNQIRQAPVPEGIGLAAYLVPVALFLAGGGFVAWFLRRSSRAPAGSDDPETPEALDPEVERRLDRELGLG